jgi:hypothetical protein
MAVTVQLYAPASYWAATPAERDRKCNGCGPGGGSLLSRALNWLIPDALLGLPIKAACQIHDWMYAEGETVADKEEADRVFLNNMLRLIEAESSWLLKRHRRSLALEYYSQVHDFGGPAFWRGKNPVFNLGTV